MKWGNGSGAVPASEEGIQSMTASNCSSIEDAAAPNTVPLLV